MYTTTQNSLKTILDHGHNMKKVLMLIYITHLSINVYINTLKKSQDHFIQTDL